MLATLLACRRGWLHIFQIGTVNLGTNPNEDTDLLYQLQTQ